HLTTRELAWFGQLYLQGGRWQGEQLLPEAYVTASTTAQVSGGYPELVKYGYLWWVSKGSAGRSAFFASGAGGQYIYVLPELNLITVITGTSTLADGRSNRVMVLKLVTKFLLSDA
ncbi:MAG: serine hydrolase, partial [Anaerolineae bacterium]|nr:serine hydrolase [Anaerolineae bacterium]